jgi:acetoacetyl-CoA synthetase
VLGNPNLPVLRGQAQCRSLGLDVRSLPPDDDPCAAIGELICANPFPSRPIGFYGDPGGERFHEAYFSQHDGIWTHGDEVEFTPEHGWILHGRSDGVLNIRGIRVGPAEIYSILHRIDEIAEAMAVEQSTNEEAGGTRLVLLVVLRQGVALDARLVARIRSELLTRGSPALVPGRIVQVDALPITHSGKRSEAAARDALNGRPIRNRDALQNPQCLDGIADDEGVSALPSFSLSAGDDGATGDTLVQDLQRICEGVLRVPSVSPSDDVFTLGGDSLTILNLFVQIERRAGSDLPLEAMVAASTIEGIATLIRAGRNEGRGSPDSARPVPRVRPVSAADIPDLCRFLERSFAKSPIPVARWEALFAHTWSNGTSNPGFVLVCREELVGFVGTLYSSREINGKTGLVCNLTSWYVVPQYRGWALALIAAAVRDTTVTYTALTPSPITLQTLQNMGFSPLERRKIVLPPLMNLETLRHKRPAIELDAEVVRRSLSGSQRRLFDDHAAPECLQLTVEDSQGRAYIIVKRRRGKRVPLSEILYCSAPTVLARHLERVKFAILGRQRTLGLLVGEHLFEPPPRGISRRAFSLYRSPIFKAAELDGLYSEFVLLPV